MRSVVARSVVSAAAALCLTLGVYVLLPDALRVQTDIVGYPTFANFNIDRYFWQYGLIVLFLPLALVSYLVLTRILVGRQGPWRPLPQPQEHIEAIPPAIGRRLWGVAVGRALLTGAVLGLEVAICLEQASEVVLTTSLAYATGVITAGWLGARFTSGDRFVVMSSVNTLAAPFAIAALWGVSQSTELTVVSTGAVHSYPWLPAWLAAGACGALLVWLALLTWRRRSRAAVLALERSVALLLVVPVGLFVFMAALPGELATLSSFEEGQVLAASELVRGGLFPWRDILVAHGLLYDVGQGLLGFNVFDDSRWGLIAGERVLLIPLTWVALYYLCAYLFSTNWLFLLATQLVVISGHVHAIEIRMILVPVALLLLAASLKRPTALRAAALTVVVAAQVIVTPEAMVAAVAVFATLIAFEFSYRERGRRLVAGYPRTTLCLAVGVVVALSWSAFLVTYRAWDDWIFGFAATIPGHRFTGGFDTTLPMTQFEIVAPVALVLVVFAFVTVSVRLRRPFAFSDWVMVAMTIFVLLYYPKFLSRADSYHLAQSFAAVVPLLFYVVFRGITFAEAWLGALARTWRLRWIPQRHTVTLPVLVVLLFTAPIPLQDAIRAAPGHFVAAAADEPAVARIGYANAGQNDYEMLRALGEAMATLLKPGDSVFDFTNAPGIFHYVLDEMPSTRYYHVSYAIRQRTQSDLVHRLQANQAAAVVFTRNRFDDFDNKSYWDGISNQVRHYEVSEFLLDHYVPVKEVGGFVLMVPRDRGARPDNDLYFRNHACDWGYVPNYFAPTPPPSAEEVSLPFRRLEPVGDSGRKEYSVTIPDNAADYRWLEVRTGRALTEGNFLVADRRGVVPHSPRAIYFKTLERGESSVRVKVGSCSQWRGYRPGAIYLSTNGPQDIREIRLVERRASAS